MTLQAPEQAHPLSGSISVSRKKHSSPLSELVKASLDEYFEQLADTQPNDLYHLVVAQVEKPLLEASMNHAGGNQTRAASLLGISRATLRKKLALYNID